MDYATRTLRKELQEQLGKLGFLEKQPTSHAVEYDLRVTIKRIEELQEGLKILEGVTC